MSYALMAEQAKSWSRMQQHMNMIAVALSIARRMLEHLFLHAGAGAVQALLVDTGMQPGREAAGRVSATASAEEATHALAEPLDVPGYAAQTVRAGDHEAVEARHCVFHAPERAHPEVCEFDLACMSAAAGRPVHRTACLLHGSPTCRFRVAEVVDSRSTAVAPAGSTAAR